MKKLYFALFLCFSVNSYSQEYGSDFPNAKVTSVTLSDTITYTFISNYFVDEYKAPLLEKRIIGRYSELIDLSINYDTQIISFKILKQNSELFLDKFVKHFRYKSYELN